MYETKPLDEATWPDFARLVEANNGVWGGCWCTWYHGKETSEDKSPAQKRKTKECLGGARECPPWDGFGSRWLSGRETLCVPF